MKKTKLLSLLIAIVMLLGGCSNFSSDVESTWVTSSSEGELVTTEESISGGNETKSEPDETEALSSEESTAESLITDSVEKEYLLKVLWKKMLQRLDAAAPNEGESTDWNRSYESEVHLQNFTLDSLKYGVILIYPESTMKAYVYYWPDNISDVRNAYKEANEKLQSVLDDKTDYVEGSLWITSAREQSELHVSGEVTNVSYEQADLFIEGIKPYTAYMMWGSVLQVAGDLYERNNGTILGNLSGKAVMTAFDFDTVTGTYWICLTGEEPVQVVVDFVNLDCGVYTSEINSTAVFDEAALESAWIGIEFDLCTTQTLK